MSGIITGPYFLKYFNDPSALAVGTMVAVLEIGAFGTSAHAYIQRETDTAFTVTSVAAGRIGDILGRRGTLFSGAVVFALGGAIQTFTNGFTIMVIGRVVAGFGVGLLSFVEPADVESHND
jgi:MFS family permease